MEIRTNKDVDFTEVSDLDAYVYEIMICDLKVILIDLLEDYKDTRLSSTSDWDYEIREYAIDSSYRVEIWAGPNKRDCIFREEVTLMAGDNKFSRLSLWRKILTTIGIFGLIGVYKAFGREEKTPSETTDLIMEAILKLDRGYTYLQAHEFLAEERPSELYKTIYKIVEEHTNYAPEISPTGRAGLK